MKRLLVLGCLLLVGCGDETAPNGSITTHLKVTPDGASIGKLVCYKRKWYKIHKAAEVEEVSFLTYRQWVELVPDDEGEASDLKIRLKIAEERERIFGKK